ncbi:MAG: hypothetical protein ACLFQV_04050 [Vulcanimicrobiota bacterium]
MAVLYEGKDTYHEVHSVEYSWFESLSSQTDEKRLESSVVAEWSGFTPIEPCITFRNNSTGFNAFCAYLVIGSSDNFLHVARGTYDKDSWLWATPANLEASIPTHLPIN